MNFPHFLFANKVGDIYYLNCSNILFFLLLPRVGEGKIGMEVNEKPQVMY